MNKEIAIIGAGNMGQAVARGLLRQKIVKTGNLVLANPNLGKLETFRNLGVTLETDNKKAAAESEILILAVKPQIMSAVLSDIRNAVPANQLVVSLAAGISLDMIRSNLSEGQPVVRVMPNLGAQVGQSMSVWIKNKFVDESQQKQVKTILSAIGKEAEVNSEEDINKATAISGSGPAYVFYLLELLEDCAIKLGFELDTAAILARQTLVGSADLIQSSDKTARELRRNVTSKGGTTEAAFNEFGRRGLGDTLESGITAAYKRTKELGQISSNE